MSGSTHSLFPLRTEFEVRTMTAAGTLAVIESLSVSIWAGE